MTFGLNTREYRKSFRQNVIAVMLFFFLLSIALNVRTQIVNFTQTVHVVKCVLLKGRFDGVICDDGGEDGIKL